MLIGVSPRRAWARPHGVGDRAGVLAAWWMVHNAQDVYPGMYDILLAAPGEGGHTQVQVANSYTNTPERFGEET